MRRFSSSSFTGMRRCEVAVGTERLASMFSTIFKAAPRIGILSGEVCDPPTNAGGYDFFATDAAAFLGRVVAFLPEPLGRARRACCLAGARLTVRSHPDPRR